MESDAELISQIKLRRSPSAALKLVERYKKQVLSFCIRIIRDRMVAEEAAQDSFMKALQKIHSINDPAKFLPWLMKLTYHTCIDYARRKKTSKEPIENAWRVESSENPNDDIERDERSRWIEVVLQSLPTEERAIVTLFYLKEMTFKEIGAICKLTESNVKIKLHRSREFLRNKLGLK